MIEHFDGERPRRKRILVTALLYGAGGIETHLLNLSRMLVERGAEITLVTRFANPETPLVRASREIPIRIFDTPFARDLRWLRLYLPVEIVDYDGGRGRGRVITLLRATPRGR